MAEISVVLEGAGYAGVQQESLIVSDGAVVTSKDGNTTPRCAPMCKNPDPSVDCDMGRVW